jgi:flavin reductase
MIEIEDFKLGMRRLAAGVSIITTLKDGIPSGIVVTSASSLTSEPPTLLVCINKSASCHSAISEAGVFCVNVLSRGDADLAALFGNPKRRDERFSERSWKRLYTGAPVLPSAIVAFDCTVDKVVPYQSHTIFIGEINGVHFNDTTNEPLLYLNGSYRQLEKTTELH